MHMRSFLVVKIEKRNEYWPIAATSYVLFIGSYFRNTVGTCLMRVGHDGYDWLAIDVI